LNYYKQIQKAQHAVHLFHYQSSNDPSSERRLLQ